VGPGLDFVIEGAGFEAAVEYADEAVAELAEGGVVADLPGSHGVVVVVVGGDVSGGEVDVGGLCGRELGVKAGGGLTTPGWRATVLELL
jgi:hypothetical protein